MNKKTALYMFLGICIILAILILSKFISHVASAIIFALALIFFGEISKEFRK